jgi:nucleotide-binding universal stress UspA family protein
MYKRILLAYDGSREGVLALREGAVLARACRAEVFLLSVAPDSAGVRMASGITGDSVSDHAQAYRDLLDRAVARLKELGFSPQARLVVGDPTPTIAAVACEIKADLVVVGHIHQSFLERWWSGDNQSYLCDHVGCSVLVACNPMSDEDFAKATQEAATA